MSDFKSENFIFEAWNDGTYKVFINHLSALYDEKYLAFHQKLVPDINNINGIRVPVLKDISKIISKTSGDVFLNYVNTLQNTSYEEVMIEGLVIGYLKCENNILKERIQSFVTKVDNWGVCDTFCANLKQILKDKNYFFEFVKELCLSEKCFEARVGIVIFLDFYLTEEYIDGVLKIISCVKLEDYYVKMAVAWLVSIAFIKFEDKTIAFLKEKTLDAFTHNKALQKVRDSKRVSDEAKEYTRTLQW